MIEPRRPPPARRTLFALGLALTFAAAACGDDDPPASPPGTGGAGPGAPAVLLSVRVTTPDNQIFYVGAFPDVPTGALDLSQMREFGGPSDASAFGGWVFVSDSESGVMSRFRVTDDLRLEEDGPALSFQARGASGYLPPLFLSPTRAYVMNPQLDEIIVWDPTAMAITGSIPVTPPALSGQPPALDGRPVRFGTAAAWDVNGANFETLQFHPAATLLLASTESDAPAAVLEDPRCMFGTFTFVDENEDLYFIGDGYRGYFREYPPHVDTAPPPCALRVRRGEARFDPDWFVDLQALTGSRAVHGAWRVQGRTFLMLAWDGARPYPENRDEIFAAELVPLLVDLEAGTSVPFPGLTKMRGGNVRRLELDGRAYFQRYAADGNSVEFGPLSTQGFTPTLAVPGAVLGVARIR